MPRNYLHVPDVVNPARAGMIPKRTAPSSITGSKPRASGDDPIDVEALAAAFK